MRDIDGSWADPVLRSLERAGADGGPLRGLTFVAKDVFDVAGDVTGAGNPTWAEEAAPAASDAEAVAALLAAGASLIGKSITDELAFSLAGTNVHHGTPRNPSAPGRVPGGSSSGSASAVAAGRCDVALGTDTGGSVRVPASYCGVWGMRPTHGRISVAGLVPLAPSFDTVGWFARSAQHLARAGRALLAAGPRRAPEAPRRIVVVDGLFGLADASSRPLLLEAADEVAAAAGIPCERIDDASVAGWWGRTGDRTWVSVYRTIQGAEAWAQHGAWVTRGAPMGPGVRGRFLAAGDVERAALARAVGAREVIRRRLEALTAEGVVLAVPSAAGVAPPPILDGGTKDDLRERTLALNCGAGLAGVPAISAPLATEDGRPLGLCLVGAPWSDESLLALAEVVDRT